MDFQKLFWKLKFKTFCINPNRLNTAFDHINDLFADKKVASNLLAAKIKETGSNSKRPQENHSEQSTFVSTISQTLTTIILPLEYNICEC